jgi:hypothetical protein
VWAKVELEIGLTLAAEAKVKQNLLRRLCSGLSCHLDRRHERDFSRHELRKMHAFFSALAERKCAASEPRSRISSTEINQALATLDCGHNNGANGNPMLRLSLHCAFTHRQKKKPR